MADKVMCIAQPGGISNLHLRDSSVSHFAILFSFVEFPHGKRREVAYEMACAAAMIANSLNDGPELVAGLRKLLEARDCFLRALIT